MKDKEGISKPSDLIETLRAILIIGFRNAEDFDEEQITDTIWVAECETLVDWLIAEIEEYVSNNFVTKEEYDNLYSKYKEAVKRHNKLIGWKNVLDVQIEMRDIEIKGLEEENKKLKELINLIMKHPLETMIIKNVVKKYKELNE